MARALARGKNYRLEANSHGIARLNLTPEVRDLVNDHADQIADVAKHAAKDVSGLSWTRRDNYSPPRVSRTDESRAAVISTRTDRTWGKKSGVKVARYRAAVIAFHPDAEGRKAGRMAIRKALRLPNVEAFEAKEREDARKKAERARKKMLEARDRKRKALIRREEKANARLQSKARSAAKARARKAQLDAERESFYASRGGKKAYQAERRRNAAQLRKAEKIRQYGGEAGYKAHLRQVAKERRAKKAAEFGGEAAYKAHLRQLAKERRDKKKAAGG